VNSRLDKIWFQQAGKFDFTADLTGTVVSCIGLGWVGLDWVVQNGPMDNSVASTGPYANNLHLAPDK